MSQESSPVEVMNLRCNPAVAKSQDTREAPDFLVRILEEVSAVKTFQFYLQCPLKNTEEQIPQNPVQTQGQNCGAFRAKETEKSVDLGSVRDCC